MIRLPWARSSTTSANPPGYRAYPQSASHRCGRREQWRNSRATISHEIKPLSPDRRSGSISASHDGAGRCDNEMSHHSPGITQCLGCDSAGPISAIDNGNRRQPYSKIGSWVEVAPFLRTDSGGFLSEPSAVTSYPRGGLPKVPLDRRRDARWVTQRSSCCQLYCS